MAPQDNNAGKLGSNDALSRMSLSGANVLLPTIAVPPFVEAPRLYNPGVKGTATAEQRTFPGAQGEADAVHYAQEVLGGIPRSDIKVVDEDQLCVLGDALLTLASDLASRNNDLVLFPIRAGHRLRQILEGMLETHPPFESVEFSEAASNPRDDFFRERLAQAVRKWNPEKPHFRVAVVDVGDSGAGTKKILQLLREVRARFQPHQNWQVNCHVFHEHADSWNFKQYQRVSGNFAAVVDTYRTSAGKQLLDDWVAAIGLAKVRRLTPGGVVSLPEVKELAQPAAVIIKSRTGFEAVASKTGRHVANSIISRYLLEAMSTSDRLRRTPAHDRWRE